MIYFVIAISFLSLLSVILLYNVLLGLFKKIFLEDLIHKISVFAFIITLVTTGLGLAYNRFLAIGLSFDYTPKFEYLHTLLQNWYVPFLILGPMFVLIFIFSLNKDRKLSIPSVSMALITELLVLISTILI